jgi:hypothetical protein
MEVPKKVEEELQKLGKVEQLLLDERNTNFSTNLYKQMYRIKVRNIVKQILKKSKSTFNLLGKSTTSKVGFNITLVGYQLNLKRLLEEYPSRGEVNYEELLLKLDLAKEKIQEAINKIVVKGAPIISQKKKLVQQNKDSGKIKQITTAIGRLERIKIAAKKHDITTTRRLVRKIAGYFPEEHDKIKGIISDQATLEIIAVKYIQTLNSIEVLLSRNDVDYAAVIANLEIAQKELIKVSHL